MGSPCKRSLVKRLFRERRFGINPNEAANTGGFYFAKNLLGVEPELASSYAMDEEYFK